MSRRFHEHATRVGVAAFSLLLLASCGEPPSSTIAAAPSTTASYTVPPFKVGASLQDLMVAAIDPASDAIWESVSEEWDKDGYREHKPTTDEEWQIVRNHAIVLQETADLLLIDGRPVAAPGKELEDADVAGVLGAEGVDAVIKADKPGFNAFAQVLNASAHEIVAAVDARDVAALQKAGAQLDAVCESCHERFWFPDAQRPPAFR
jgi:hypothetical protein